MKRISIMVVTLACAVWSCSEGDELQKTIFINDENDKGLPQYSELGYNTFGAYYDREAFISDTRVPMKVVVTGGKSTTLFFNGRRNYNQEMSIILKLNDFSPQDYKGLASLNGIPLDLTNTPYKVLVKKGTDEYEAQVLNGSIVFKKVQQVIVDGEQAEVILSGTFEFQAFVDGEPITVSKGRFDLGVGEDNFFKN